MTRFSVIDMVKIFPSALNGSIAVPPSKSCSHRALICAALSHSPSTLHSLSECEDVMSTKRCLEALGAGFDGDTVFPIDRTAQKCGIILDCGESGSTLRFLLPIVCALGCDAEFRLSPRLAMRPLAPLCELLCAHGASIKRNGDSVFVGGRITAGEYCIDGSVSSQFICGLLMALPLVGGGSVNITPPIVSANYIDITIDYLNMSKVYVNRIGNTVSVFGDYAFPSEHTLEGDWSAAAFWLCAQAMGLEAITLTGLPSVSSQGDRRICEVLRSMGFSVSESGLVCRIATSADRLVIDASDIPDLVPPLAVLAATLERETCFSGVERLRSKESDRLNAIVVMLTSMGICTRQSGAELTVLGGRPCGGSLRSFSDHRIAMAAVIAAAAASSPSDLDDIGCIAKSYPRFIEDFKSLGGQIL